MRFAHPDGSTVHLAYCSNVHPAEDLAGVIGQLTTYADPVRRRLDRDRIGIGLWLAADVARRLDEDPTAVDDLRAALTASGCEVVTLNGFPYTGFHDEVVKHRVYRPDWAEAERAAHTLRLARVLTRLLPEDVELGTISTLPLGWPDRMDEGGTAAALAALDHVTLDLAALASTTGRRIALALEPEPGCRMETTGQAAAVLAGRGGPHLGVCADLAHMAVQFEDPAVALPALASEGLPIHKAQVSAGLRVPSAADHAAREGLRTFTASPFLHQTRTVLAGVVVGVDDLHLALDGGLPKAGEWRTHVHLPIHLPDAGAVGGTGTTRDVLEAGLAALVGGPTALTRHLEVETYTWSTLPADVGGSADPVERLVGGLAAELGWAADHLSALGLRELP
jgi:sugar phosphate isomerase/epimerase